MKNVTTAVPRQVVPRRDRQKSNVRSPARENAIARRGKCDRPPGKIRPGYGAGARQ
ncbi:MAG: hypothetical protein AB4352_07470 [Hormoscilla sp.]